MGERIGQMSSAVCEWATRLEWWARYDVRATYIRIYALWEGVDIRRKFYLER